MEYRKLSSLKPLTNNPRRLRKAQFADLCASIQAHPGFFAARPLILSDRTGELIVIAGNMKAEAAKSLKMGEVPTVLLSGLTEAQEREIIIRDNAHAGEWDYDCLANVWSDLPLADWGVGLPTDWKEAPLDVLDSAGDLSGSNYGDARSDKIPVNILGIGGMVERALMERVKERLVTAGAQPDTDNGPQLTEIFATWVG